MQHFELMNKALLAAICTLDVFHSECALCLIDAHSQTNERLIMRSVDEVISVLKSPFGLIICVMRTQPVAIFK